MASAKITVLILLLLSVAQMKIKDFEEVSQQFDPKRNLQDLSINHTEVKVQAQNQTLNQTIDDPLNLPWGVICGVGFPAAAILGGFIGYHRQQICKENDKCGRVLIGSIIGVTIFGLVILLCICCFGGTEPARHQISSFTLDRIQDVVEPNPNPDDNRK